MAGRTSSAIGDSRRSIAASSGTRSNRCHMSKLLPSSQTSSIAEEAGSSEKEGADRPGNRDAAPISAKKTSE